MSLPYVPGPSADPEALSAVASLVMRDYGYTGYTIAVEAGGYTRQVFRVRSSDGGEFRILADRYGNAWTLPERDDLAEAIGVFDAERAAAGR